MVGSIVIKCSKCKKALFYLNDRYKMSSNIICITCGNNTITKKKKPIRTIAANYAKAKRGIRKDIHPTYYFRSATEANFARILQYHKVKWKFEEKKFDFKQFGYNRKPFAYLMDFEVKAAKKLPDGITSGWVEVKGFMDAKSRNKLRRFKKCFPEEADKTTIVIFARGRKKDIEFCKKTGYKYIFFDDLRKKYSPIIPTWE